MTPKTPADFWQNEMGDNSYTEYTPRTPYVRTTLLDQKGQNIFNMIGRYLCQVHSAEFMKGYLDLDEVWQTSDNPKVIEWRNTPELGKFETPFSGKLAYLARIFVMREMQTGDEDKKPTGDLNIGYMKVIRSGNYYLSGSVNLFHNLSLGWTPDLQQSKTKKRMVDGVLQDVEIEGTKDKHLYHRTAFFVDAGCGERLIEELTPKLKDGDTYYLFMIGDITKGDWEGKPSHTMNVDDYILLT